MKIEAIKTKIFIPPKDDLFGAIRASVKTILEKSILVISSKVVSISEGRCVPIGSIDKKELIKRESDLYLKTKNSNGNDVFFTITKNIIVRSAGIDESNGNGFYILWPKNPKKSAKDIWKWLKQTYKIKNVGVIIVDSNSIPLRRGTIGLSLSHYGFKSLKDYRKDKDLFGRNYKSSQTNFPDSFAAIAVATMGEGSEQTPLVLIEDLPHIEFGEFKPSNKKYSKFEVELEEDVYKPFFGTKKWKKSNRN